jgi:hypothetical protein
MASHRGNNLTNAAPVVLDLDPKFGESVCKTKILCALCADMHEKRRRRGNRKESVLTLL